VEWNSALHFCLITWFCLAEMEEERRICQGVLDGEGGWRAKQQENFKDLSTASSCSSTSASADDVQASGMRLVLDSVRALGTQTSSEDMSMDEAMSTSTDYQGENSEIDDKQQRIQQELLQAAIKNASELSARRDSFEQLHKQQQPPQTLPQPDHLRMLLTTYGINGPALEELLHALQHPNLSSDSALLQNGKNAGSMEGVLNSSPMSSASNIISPDSSRTSFGSSASLLEQETASAMLNFKRDSQQEQHPLANEDSNQMQIDAPVAPPAASSRLASIMSGLTPTSIAKTTSRMLGGRRKASSSNPTSSSSSVASDCARIVSDQTSSGRRRWTPDEDERLRQAVAMFGDKPWKDIAAVVGTRDNVQCLQRWRKSLKPGLRKGPWKPEEDEMLRAKYKEMQENPLLQWSWVASHIPGRNGKQCRERWQNFLDENIKKGGWTPEEDALLQKLHGELNGRWANIARQMPGRTENSVKVRFQSLKRMKDKKAKGGSPVASIKNKGAKRASGTPAELEDLVKTAGSGTCNKKRKSGTFDAEFRQNLGAALASTVANPNGYESAFALGSTAATPNRAKVSRKSAPANSESLQALQQMLNASHQHQHHSVAFNMPVVPDSASLSQISIGAEAMPPQGAASKRMVGRSNSFPSMETLNHSLGFVSHSSSSSGQSHQQELSEDTKSASIALTQLLQQNPQN